MQGQLREILQNQREILAHIVVMKRELRGLAQEFERKRDEAQTPVSVPNRIRVNICQHLFLVLTKELQLSGVVTRLNTHAIN